ncbi:molybdate ABC transporter substrate-binding protein [Reichenbachiella sp. MSK19-1]|nr:molybdate ABC transporter substrate-binding protein [Reichenbachiella sp. MSK19-1]
MYLKQIVAAILLSILSLGSFAQSLRIAAASSMVDFLEEIKPKFEATHPQSLEIITNSSGTLANQIKNGAPFDIFLSADQKYTTLLHQEGFGVSAPVTFAYNKLILYTKKDIAADQVHDYLAGTECTNIGIAQPDLAPFGNAARKYLTQIKVLDDISNKLIYGQNISIVNQYIYTHSVDAAFTSLSSKNKLSSKVACCWIELSSETAPALPQSALILNDSTRDFLDYLRNDNNAKSIIQKYGYLNN